MLSLSVSDPKVVEGSSGTTSLSFVVGLSGPLGQTVTVDYFTTDGTAVSGADYTAVSGTVTFNVGETAKLVQVPILGDALYEPNETVLLNLLNPVGDTIADDQGSGMILDDDLPPVLSVDDTSKSEGNAGSSNADVTIRLSTASGQPVVVNYATTDGSANSGTDYLSTSGTLTFQPGETAKTVPVSILGDTLGEGNETVNFNVLGATGATIGKGQGILTILDDDPQSGLFIDDVAVTEGISGTTSAIFTVRLATERADTVTVDYSTGDGTAKAVTDYTPSAGVLTFAPGETLKNVVVPVVGDNVPEDNETFTVTLSNPVNAPIGRSQAFGTILNDDISPNLAIDDTTVTEGDNGTQDASFTVRLSKASAATISVNYFTTNLTAQAGSDYSATTSVLTFAPGETVKLIPVPVLGDTLPEADELFTVNLVNASGALISDGQALGTIDDNDLLPGISVDSVSIVEGNSGTVDATFTVTLDAANTLPVTVNYATANITALAGSDYTQTNGLLTFEPGETTRTVAVPVIGDTIREVNEQFALNLSGAKNGQITVGRGVGTIVDDDATPRISVDEADVIEGDAGTANVSVTVRLSATSGLPVTVNYGTSNQTAVQGSDYAPVSGSLTIPAGEDEATIEIPIVGDLLSENIETFALNLSAPTNATISDSQSIVTIFDNDDEPTLTVADASVKEGNFGLVQLPFQARLSAPSAVTVKVDYAITPLTATPDVDYQPITGTLTFAPGEISKTIGVPVIGDTLNEANEQFALDFTDPIGLSLKAPRSIGTILDDDAPPTVSIGNGVVLEGDSGSTPNSFPVTLSSPSNQVVTVNYRTLDLTATGGQDYGPVTGVVTFQPGETIKTVVVPVLGDIIREPNETFAVRLDGPSNATIAAEQGIGTILDDDGLVVTSAADSGEGTLREAIIKANQTAGADTITFAVPSIGPVSIAVRSPLPTIIDPLVIDATTQPGYAGSPVVELNGAGAGASADGLKITAGSSVVRGLAINRFTGSGIVIEGLGGNVVQANWLGLTFGANADFGNTLYGILINASASNIIGGSIAGTANVISGNDLGGVYIGFAGASGNRIQGNLIGTNAQGTSPVGNNLNGIFVDSARNNLIGGGNPGMGNVIAANAANGIQLFGPSTRGNQVKGNKIGVGLVGTPLGNRLYGILINQGTRHSNVIGGRSASEANTIRFNGLGSIRVVPPKAPKRR